MNRNARARGIKFRELDYSVRNATDGKNQNKNQIRSREDVLKLFVNVKNHKQKEEINADKQSNNIDNEFQINKDYCNEIELSDTIKPIKNNMKKNPHFKVQDSKMNNVKKSDNQPKEDEILGVSKSLDKSKLEIVREQLQIQSIVQETSLKMIEKRIYNVLIGKISTRKHKQWDSDGILEINGRSAVLKDSNGKYLNKTIIKPEMIEEGFRLCIGGKEIEIVELISSKAIQNNDKTESQCSSSEFYEPPIKKAKLSKSFVPIKSGSALHSNYEPLILPHPSVDLKWSQDNIENRNHEVSVDGCLVSKLRSHQREGVVFLYKCIMGMNNLNSKGAILADEMGLGKTLQCVTLIWTLLKKGPYGKPVLKRVLIVAPSSLCGNWNKEFKHWLGSIKIAPFVVESNQKVKDFTKTPRACVMIISYEMFVRNVDDVNNLNFDLLICDEGHRLKNSEVKTLKCLNQLNCQRRILLTGTPMQNDLQEFYTLASFVNPNILGTFSDFKSYYEYPIVRSQRATADEIEITLGQERAKELHERSKTFILRRTNNVINNYLPQKHELVIFCSPTLEQKNLYSLVTDYWFNRSVINENVMSLTVITALKKICNHPYFFINNKSNILNEVLPLMPINLSIINNSFSYSSKFKIVQAVLKNLKQTPEKIVLISYFTQTLDLLEKVICTEGLQFCRLDGNTPPNMRMKMVEKFNSKDNTVCRVFLLSAKAGGVGLNLVGASRLILFDSDWNPANDAQAMARIWRDGQNRSVYIYRLLTTGTIEEKIYQRQISKIGLSEAVVDANLISSLKLSSSELKDLFTLDDRTSSVTHDLMDCSCTGYGEIPSELEEKCNSGDSRECQFDLKKKQSQQQITINQLKNWQHYKQPISSNLTKELMVNQAQDIITFIFKNSIKK